LYLVHVWPDEGAILLPFVTGLAFGLFRVFCEFDDRSKNATVKWNCELMTSTAKIHVGLPALTVWWTTHGSGSNLIGYLTVVRHYKDNETTPLRREKELRDGWYGLVFSSTKIPTSLNAYGTRVCHQSPFVFC
jgi:hypothetical protein